MSQTIINPFSFGIPVGAGLQCETGTFTKVVSPTTLQNIPVSFPPKALIIWAEREAVSDTDIGATSAGSLGFVDDSDNNRCQFYGYEDALAAVESKKSMSNTRAIVFFDDTPSPFTIDAEATITLTPSGFSLTWNTQNAIPSRIHFIAYGGADITGVQCGDLNKLSTVVPATQSIPTDLDVRNIVEGQGVVFLAYAGSAIFPSVSGNGTFGLGVGTKAAPLLTNAVLMYQDDRAANPTQPIQVFNENQFLRNTTSNTNTLLDEGEFGGFTASGFDLDLGPTTTSTGPRMLFLIIKGGLWQSGVETARTTVGTKATTVDFEPCGIFTFSVKKTANGDAFEEISANVGAADASNNHASGGMTDQSAVTPTNIGVMSSISKVVRYHNPVNQAVLSESNLDSFTGNSFVLDWTTVDANAYKFAWVVAGNDLFPGIGTWLELGRTTLGAPSDDVIVTGLPNAEYYMILADMPATTDLQPVIRFGDSGSPDVGANYANRRSDNGAADITSGTATEIISNTSDAVNKQWFEIGWISNLTDHEKLMVGRTARTQNADGIAPARSEFTGKWVNDAPIDTIALRNLGAGDFQAGTELIVLGWSRFDDNLSGQNFWELLAEVQATGIETVITTPVFTPRKYLWITAVSQHGAGGGTYQLRIGHDVIDTGLNYHSRFANLEFGDATVTRNHLTLTSLGTNARTTAHYYCNNKDGIEKLLHGRLYSNVPGLVPPIIRYHNTVKWDGQSNGQINIAQIFQTVAPALLTAGAGIRVWGHD